MFDHDSHSLARLSSMQQVGLEKHQRMIQDALRWQEVSRPAEESSSLPRLYSVLAAILNLLTK